MEMTSAFLFPPVIVLIFVADVSSHSKFDTDRQNVTRKFGPDFPPDGKHPASDQRPDYDYDYQSKFARPVSEDCLHCICFVLTECTMPRPICQIDIGSLSCGPFQIKQSYWSDARLKGGDLMGSWRMCSALMQCSKDSVQGYMARYAVFSRLGYQPTCEDFARIHNGGPNGYKKTSTIRFWQKVKECLE